MKWGSVVWAFTNLEAGFWHPLTWLSIMLDCQLFGFRAGGHHLTSLLLHAANTVLLFVVFRRMTATTWRSAFVAALFALHPLHVEPVAWAASRKDVLSTFFGLLTLWAYVRYTEGPGTTRRGEGRRAKSELTSRKPGTSTARPARSLTPSSILHFPSAIWYGLALLFVRRALMSKTMVVTLPLVLLLLDWWPLRRLQRASLRGLVVEKLPFLALSLFAGLLTVHAERGVGALPSATLFPLQFRLANAVLLLALPCPTFWPVNLAVFYPYPESFSSGGSRLARFCCCWFQRSPCGVLAAGRI